MRVLFLCLLLCAGSLAAAGPAAGSPRMTCPQLAGTEFPQAHLDSAKTEGSYCVLRGVLDPSTHFEIRLPTHGWHGQYLQRGCGGLCGQIPLEPADSAECAAPANSGFAVAADDQGHRSADPSDGRWGAHDPGLRRVFGLTSEHSTARLAKAVIARFYGRAPAYSYYDGCSGGGREAMMLAQRYPEDFDGIVAGAPANNWAPLLGLYQPWLARVNTDANGRDILGAEKLPALHRAVLEACGNGNGNGGLGVLTDPRHCGFDPASLACARGTDSPGCLTPPQVHTVRELYRGPRDAAGRNLFNGGEPYGSELAWREWLIGGAHSTAARLGLDYLKYLAYQRNPPAGFDLADVRFTDAEFTALNRLGDRIYNANDPDLSRFRAHGGRLLLYHGWADQAISPWSSIDYYAALERSAGGFAAGKEFSRFYLVPGAHHCLTGAGTKVDADFLTPVVDWVEHAKAPEAIRTPIVRDSDGTQLVDQTIRPHDALAPAYPDKASLNTGYDYVGSYR